MCLPQLLQFCFCDVLVLFAMLATWVFALALPFSVNCIQSAKLFAVVQALQVVICRQRHQSLVAGPNACKPKLSDWVWGGALLERQPWHHMAGTGQYAVPRKWQSG